MRVLRLHEDRRGPGQGGGAETLLANEMAALRSLGHDVGWWWGQEPIADMVARYKPDVCHVSTIHNLLGVGAALWLQAQGIPHVWALMDYWPFCGWRMLISHADQSCAAVRGVCDGKCDVGRASIQLRRAVRGSPLISLNRYSTEIYERNGLPIFATVPLGIDADYFTPEPSQREAGRVITMSAWPTFPTKGMHVLRAALEELGVQAHLITGLPRDRVRDELRRGDVFIFPSTYEETWGLSLTEAMACGCACISSDVSGPKAQIEHGTNGLLFENRNAHALAGQLRWLLDHPAERERIRANGRAWVEQEATLEAMGRRWVAVYERVLND